MRYRVPAMGLLLGLMLLVFSGCSLHIEAPTPVATERPTVTSQVLVDLAKADLRARLGNEGQEIIAQRVEETEFSDTSLGVPEPGAMYAQVITSGYIITLVTAEGKLYEYHGSGDRVVLVPSKTQASSKHITIESVSIESGERITFSGQSALADGTCLHTQLWRDDEPQPWWPADTCVTVESGEWEIAVPLGSEGTPDTLDPTGEYNVQVWAADDPHIAAPPFPFDLAGPPSPAAASVPISPEAVVQDFYDWYIGYARTVGNPLVDRAYASSKYLTQECVLRADDRIASLDRRGYDPFLCAQDVPDSVTTVETNISGGQATVSALSSFHDHRFIVTLRLVDGQWRIDDVSCGGPAASEDASEYRKVEITEVGLILEIP